MAEITDPDVIAFVNDIMRVLADHMIGQKQGLDFAKTRYVNDILPIITALPNGDLIVDGSETDGRIQLTVGDVKGLAGFYNALITAYEAVGVPEALNKAAVNPKNPLAS